MTLVRSLSGQRKANRETIRSLGLGRIGSSALRADSDCLRGMLRKVAHLVTVEEVLSQ